MYFYCFNKIILARRRYKTRKKALKLNKNTLWAIMIIVWGLYFFSFFLAKWSPIFELLQKYAAIPFGDSGLSIFFALCIIVWIMIIAKWYLMNQLINQSLALLFLISAILNFPIIEWSTNVYQECGWYISRPLLELLDWMFGWQALAIKVFIILLLIWVIMWILFTFNFKLPSVKIEKPAQEKVIHTDKKVIKVNPVQTAWEIKTIISWNQTKQNTSSSNSGSILDILWWKKHIEVNDKSTKVPVKRQPTIRFSWDKPTFSTSLLKSWNSNSTINEKFLVEKAKSLQDKLMEFNVPVTIEWFDLWPSVVQIRIKPEAWVAISKIESLTNDIKLSLKSKSLRIVAPIPGTDTVWIQIPNPDPKMVRLQDIIASEEFQKWMTKDDTNLTLWKWIDGSVIVKCLDEMPHLLVAWATGSWKSVWVNWFILSLMYQNTPSELKFLMVDPKQVELELYSGLPYMLGPIVSDPDKALKLLRWAVDEMERRYTLLKEKRVRNITEYNQKIIWEKMFRIVFVIDELADMMMHKNKKDVETCITRIAQKARAVWIHLIVATQRPSVNVITWLIKANMPTRIAFWVVSQIDSMTILWRKWAEDLVWKWDLLYIDTTTKRPIRAQSPFVETWEIETVVQTLKNKYMNWLSEDDIYNPDIIQALEDKMETAGWSFGWGGNGTDEELIQQAIQVIAETRKASATLLQRKLNVWFARAARIMDELEERWIVWPQEWAKPRDIYI